AQARRAALSPRASDPALALARQQLPASTRAGTRRLLASDEAAAVESNDVETTILCGLVERAAHGDAIAVAAGGGEADPVGMRRRLPGVRLRLIRPAIIGDDVARVEDGLCHPQLDQRQLTGRTLFAPRARWPWWSPHLRVVLKLRDDPAHDLNHELTLGGDPCFNALIDLSQRGRHNVELALARRRPSALGFHTAPALNRVLGLLRRRPRLRIQANPGVGQHHLPWLIG